MVLQKIKNIVAAVSTEYAWLFTVISLAIMPHIIRIPVWVTVLFFLLAFWKLLFGNPSRAPGFANQLLRLAIIIIIITGTLITYGTLTGRDAGISLLVMLTGMKYLETRNRRDYYITSYISMFLLLTNFLFTQSILTALYMIIAVIVFACTLIAYNDNDEVLKTRERIRIAGTMVLQSLPLMLVLFVLFPRLPGPIWGLPRDAHAGLSGIDDEMSPGSVSRLTQSNAIAFRVQFEGSIPEQSLLYWRGPVLTQTDGVKWFPDKPAPFTTEIAVAGEPVKYTVTLEPTEHNWLYSLEIPSQSAEGGKFTNDIQLKTLQPVSKRIRYEMTSYTDYKITTRDGTSLESALQLPYGYHSRAIALGKSWREQGLNNDQIVRTALRMFNEQEFYYTTTPPQMLQDVVDQFLFDARRGFCEHYAASFTILMRAAGIPARIVTGYQGGTVNPVDGYLVVRQRDAHAWTEVWLGGKGWTRVDPTAAVAPARVLQGIENALPEGILDVPLGLQNYKAARDIWLRVRDTIDAANNRWNQWILSYDDRQQMLLLSRLGMGNFDLRALGVTLVLSFLVVFTSVYLWMFRRQAEYRYATRNKDMALKLYDVFCNKLAKLDIKRINYEGPVDFATRAKARRRDLAGEIGIITKLYIDVRYGDRTEHLQDLELHVKAFKPAAAVN